MEAEHKFAITKWSATDSYEKITMGAWNYLTTHAPDGFTTIAKDLTEEETQALGKILGCAEDYTWKKLWK
jgi:hypothetical protein